ncbi:MAG: hypothetical protein ACFB01_10355 [Cohaesibacteraceae bacterium]
MPMIKAFTQTVERAIESYNRQRMRQEAERLTEMQYAREMRNRCTPDSAEFYYYNAIVKRCGGN